MPIFYECQRCTACCRWPGEVHLTEAEISRLADHLELSEFDFIQRFTDLSANRQHLVLKEKLNGECILLDGPDCTVQPVKPQQCRGFPNLWNFPGFERICHAIPVALEQGEYARRVELTMGRRPASESKDPQMPPVSAGGVPKRYENHH